MVADKSDLADFRGFFHDALPISAIRSKFVETLSIAAGTCKRSNVGLSDALLGRWAGVGTLLIAEFTAGLDRVSSMPSTHQKR